MTQSRNWCFTWNNPDYEAEQPNVWPDVRWAIWQHEVGAEGTPHYQGYVVFDDNKRLTWLVKNLPHGIHWKKRIGDHAQAKAYHSKDDTRTDGPWTFGVEPEQGKRNDLSEIAEYTKTHSMKDVATEYPAQFIRYERGIAAYKNIITPDRSTPTMLEVIWGPPGKGKSTYVHGLYPEAFWLKRARTGEPWWDGYDGQSTVIIDEFYGWIGVDTMSRLIDFTPYQVEIKNKTVKFTSERIIILSNKDPYQWWSCDLHGMKRRLEEASIWYVPDFDLFLAPTHPDYPPRIDLPFYGAQR